MKLLQDKNNSFSSIFYLQYDIFIIWEIQYGCSWHGHIIFPQIVKMLMSFILFICYYIIDGLLELP